MKIMLVVPVCVWGSVKRTIYNQAPYKIEIHENHLAKWCAYVHRYGENLLFSPVLS